MAVTSGFFNSVNGDRKYSAEHMSMFFDKLITSGVYPNPSTNLQVISAGGMNLNVLAGRGIIDCRWINNDANELLTLEQSDALLNRIDAVVMVLDLNDSVRDCHLAIKKGTPATTPVAPEMERSTYVKEYCLATVYVRALAESVTQANITDTRANTAVCGWVTSLIDQVDTETLFLQWQTAYQKFYDDSDAEFDEWFKHIKGTLSTAVVIKNYESHYTTSAANETVIPVQIPLFVFETDILHVYINGMKLIPDYDYTSTDYQKVTLLRPVDAGTTINFVVYKSIDGTDATTVMDYVEELEQVVLTLESERTKIYKNASVTAASWTQSDGYYVASITNALITANDVVNVNFHLASMGYVNDAEVLGVTDSYNGGFKIYANKQPTRMISFDYVVLKGQVM